MTPGRVTELLTPFVSEARRATIERVLDGRTRRLAVVLDRVHDLGNAQAVFRTAESLGVVEIHVVAAKGRSRASNRVSQGADKWVEIHRWREPAEAVEALRARGFRIAAASPAAPGPIAAFRGPTALVFGSEGFGLSPELESAADERFALPMVGFTESYNVSVAAALALYDAFVRRRGAGDLAPDERSALRAEYYRKSVKNADAILRRLG